MELNSSNHLGELGELIKHAEFKSLSDSESVNHIDLIPLPSGCYCLNCILLLGLTVNGCILRSKRKCWVLWAQTFPSFPVSFGNGLKGMQEKFSLGKEAILTRGGNTQDPQVSQLLPKLLPTEKSEVQWAPRRKPVTGIWHIWNETQMLHMKGLHC